MRMMRLTFMNGNECLLNPLEVLAVDSEARDGKVSPRTQTVLFLAHPLDREDPTAPRLWVQESVDEVARKWEAATEGRRE